MFISVLIGVLSSLYLLWTRPPWPLLAGVLVVDDCPGPADAIIVLAGDSGRERHAVDLYQRGLASKIVMSGCGNEAGEMAKRAVLAGVKEKDIVLEGESKSTYENALFSREILLKQNWRSAIVVSSPYHMRRARLVFERVFRDTGVKLLYSASKYSDFNPDGRCAREIDRQIVRSEYIKLIYYWFRYW